MNGLKTTGAREALLVMILGLLPACSADDGDASGDAGANNGGGGDSSGGGGNPAHGGGPAFVYDDVVDGCVKLVACGPPDSMNPTPLRIGVPGLGTSLDICVTGVLDLLADDGIGNDGTRAYRKVIDCARDHADCSGFRDCLTYPYTDQACDDEGPRCDGDRLVACLYVGGNKAMVTECAVLGMTCVEGGPEPQCGTGVACTDGDPVTCDAEGRVVSCQQGIQVRTPCAPGMVCTPDAAPYCVGAGEPCAQPGMRRCTPEGNVATCYPVPGDPTKGRERVVDCVSQHAVCDPEDFRCVPTATHCVGGENDTCLDDGSGFTGCANGQVITVPCARLGGTTCTYNRGGAGCE